MMGKRQQGVHMDPKYVWLLVFQLLWIVFTVAAATEKIEHNTFHDYIRHFTNWSWSLQILFYALTWLGFLWPDFLYSVIVIFFFITWGTIWVVAILVQCLILTDSNFIMQYVRQYSAGLVIFGNDLYHLFPVVVILIFAFVLKQEIHNAFRWAYADIREPGWLIALGVLQIFSPIILLLLYISIFDPMKVYNAKISPGQGAFVALATLIFFSGFAYWFFGGFGPRFGASVIEGPEYELDMHGRRHGSAVVLRESPPPPRRPAHAYPPAGDLGSKLDY